MIIRIPERKYLEVLMAGKMSSPLFVEELSNRRIQVPKDKELIAIHDELAASNPEYFTSEMDPDPDWIKDMGLSPMFYYRWKKPTDLSLHGCEGAFRMLEDPRMMKYMHLLAFAGIPKDDIELILNAKYNISYETDEFQVYFQFFSNYDGWTYTDKELFSDQIIDPELRKQYKLALKEDRAQLVWEIGLGTDPDLSVSDLLHDMFNDSYRYFKRFQKNRPDDAQKYAALAVKISDRLEGIKDKDSDAQSLISQLKINLSNQESRPDPKQQIVNFSELHIEIPIPTGESIPNLDVLMNQDGPVKNIEGDE